MSVEEAKPVPAPGTAIDMLLRPDQKGWNVLQLARLEASKQSARFLLKHMVTAKPFPAGRQLLEYAVNLALEDARDTDHYLEFGVASGRTINCIADVSKRKVYGFDSFDGLPEDWTFAYPKGRFAGQLPKVRDNVELVVGWFTDTLPKFAAGLPKDATVGFLHVDCDLYSSTVTVLWQLAPFMRDGTVIVFDEYFNYVGWKQHEHKAFKEFLKTFGYRAEYLAFVPVHQQVAVRIHKL
ncbi:MAG: class I SAM-dependent methyltransferase [Rhodobacter sp.]|nr:class I SAM-dependent methyltransferase [Rhodobacter sp.]